MMRMLATVDRFLERADRALAEGARWPLALFGLALVLKLVYVVHSADALYARVPIMDSKYYDQLAQEIAGGRWRLHDALFMAPLYPLFLSLVYAIAGRDFMLVRLLQVAGGAATVALAFLLGRRLFRPTAALAGALILILYGATTFYESELLVEWMGALLNCTALLILYVRRPAPVRHCAAAGAVLEEEIRVVPAAGERDLEQLAPDLLVDGVGAGGTERREVASGARHEESIRPTGPPREGARAPLLHAGCETRPSRRRPAGRGAPP